LIKKTFEQRIRAHATDEQVAAANTVCTRTYYRM
jgi:hypothetical protein